MIFHRGGSQAAAGQLLLLICSCCCNLDTLLYFFLCAKSPLARGSRSWQAYCSCGIFMLSAERRSQTHASSFELRQQPKLKPFVRTERENRERQHKKGKNEYKRGGGGEESLTPRSSVRTSAGTYSARHRTVLLRIWFSLRSSSNCRAVADDSPICTLLMLTASTPGDLHSCSASFFSTGNVEAMY